MSYASTGLIEATDYNNLAWGGTQGVYTSATKNVAYVMGVGSGAVGYGQDISAINTVAAAGTVTATQWSGLLTTLNKGLGHQSGAGAQLSVPTITAGGTITYAATLATAVTTINTNAALNTALGALVTGGNYAPNPTAGVNVAYGESTVPGGQRIITFASGDAARYFFNAGGSLQYHASVVSNDGTARSNGIRDNIGTVNYTMGAAQYRALVAGNVVVVQNTEAGTYSGDFVKLYTGAPAVNTSGHGDNGGTIYFYYNLYSAGHGSWNTSMNITVNHRVDIQYPESTYLTSGSWGTPVVS
jgi:hypothetical protein